MVGLNGHLGGARRFWKMRTRSTRQLIKFFSVIGVMTGAIVGMDKAFPVLEPFAPAHRGYVRDQAEDVRQEWKAADTSLLTSIRDFQVEQAEGKRSAVRDSRAKWLFERNKTQDPVTQNLIDQRLGDLDAELERLNNQLRTLNQLRIRAH